MATPIESTPYYGPWQGLWARRQEARVPPGFMRLAQNVELFGTAVAPRGGVHRLLTNACAGRIHAILHAVFRNGTDQILVAAGSKLQRVKNGGAFDDPPVDLTLALPTGTPARVGGIPTVPVMFGDRAIFVNGADLDVQYNGTAVHQLGIVGPTVAPTFGAQVAGIFTGPYRYVYLWRNAKGDPSELSPPALITYGANQTAPMTASASPDPQVVKTERYRTGFGGGGSYYFVDEINSNGGNFPNDATGDDQLGEPAEEFVNFPSPTPMLLIAAWPQAGRLVGVSLAEPSVLYFTDLGSAFLKPASWPPENFIPISYDDGERIVVAHALYDSLISQKPSSTWRIASTPPTHVVEPVHFAEDHTGIGGLCQLAVSVADTDLFLPGFQGAYAMSRWQDTGFESNLLTDAIELLWAQLTVSDRTRFHTAFLREHRQLRVWTPQPPATDPDRLYVYQLPHGEVPGAWTWWDVPATASAVIRTTAGDRVYIGRADGLLEEMDQGNEDHWTGSTPGNGTAILFEWEPVFFMPAPENDQVVFTRWIDLLIRAEAPTTFVLLPRRDFSVEGVPIAFDVAPVGGFIADTDPASLPGAGIAGDETTGTGTLLGEPAPTPIRVTAVGLGLHHTMRLTSATKGADFRVMGYAWRWQRRPLKVTTGRTIMQPTQPYF